MTYWVAHSVFFRQSQFVLRKKAWCVLLHPVLDHLEVPSQIITPWCFLLKQGGERVDFRSTLLLNTVVYLHSFRELLLHCKQSFDARLQSGSKNACANGTPV